MALEIANPHQINGKIRSYKILKIDRELAQKHLCYLGYKPGEAYLRFFYHSSDDRKNKDKGRKESQCNWTQIEEYQKDGRGVYVVVNGASGGHTDAKIKQCYAIFCEWDDIPLAEQFEKWSELGFVEPTFTIYSGDRSMQPYWLFNEPIAPEQWRELQVLPIEVMEADESNKNPSRVFRLAGAWHVKPERQPLKTEIVGESGIRYSYNDLRDRLLALYQELLIRRQLEFEQQQQNLLLFSTPIPPTAMASDMKPVLRHWYQCEWHARCCLHCHSSGHTFGTDRRNNVVRNKFGSNTYYRTSDSDG